MRLLTLLRAARQIESDTYPCPFTGCTGRITHTVDYDYDEFSNKHLAWDSFKGDCGHTHSEREYDTGAEYSYWQDHGTYLDEADTGNYYRDDLMALVNDRRGARRIVLTIEARRRRPWFPVGTRSLLWGGHQFIIHPLAVAWGWRRKYGEWPKCRQEWAAIVIHDWGYWGCLEMDGAEGKLHPRLGAELMARWFDGGKLLIDEDDGTLKGWGAFAAGHSRSYAEMLAIFPSKLMPADKLATALIPLWLYVLLIRLSGEWEGYLFLDIQHGYAGPVDLYGWAREKQKEWIAKFLVLADDSGNSSIA